MVKFSCIILLVATSQIRNYLFNFSFQVLIVFEVTQRENPRTCQVVVNMSECDLLPEFPWRHRVNARHDVTFCYGLHGTATPFTCNGNRSQHGDRDCRSASRRHHGREQTTVLQYLLPRLSTSILYYCRHRSTPTTNCEKDPQNGRHS